MEVPWPHDRKHISPGSALQQLRAGNYLWAVTSPKQHLHRRRTGERRHRHFENLLLLHKQLLICFSVTFSRFKQLRLPNFLLKRQRIYSLYLVPNISQFGASLVSQTWWLGFAFSSLLFATFESLLFHIHPEFQPFTYVDPTNETCNSNTMLPTGSRFVTWGMLVPVSVITPIPRFYCRNKQAEPSPCARLHPTETRIRLQTFTPCCLSHPQSCPQASHSEPAAAIPLPSVPRLPERWLHLQALYLNRCHTLYISITSINTWL